MDPAARGRWGAVVGLAAWGSGAYLLAHRSHFVYHYAVQTGESPSLGLLFALSVMGLALALAAFRAARDAPGSSGLGRYEALVWLASCGLIPLAEQLRAWGVALPVRFAEPLWFAFATSMCAWKAARRAVFRPTWGAGTSLAVLAVAILACAAWWFWQGHLAYRDYLLGYPDFADYGRRVVNTWEGRGFLQKSPHWPTFFDHFQPGLAALAPLWGLWPDVHLFLLVQAFCLALPAVVVFGMARRLGAGPGGAAVWGGAYLALPAVGQLNLNFSYGFHPVSLALVMVMGVVGCALARRPGCALVIAVLSCTIEECVFVVLFGLSVALAALEWSAGRARSEATRDPPAERSLTGLSRYAWLAAAGACVLGFALVVRWAGLLEGTLLWRLKNLGSTPMEIALSPVLHPGAFWGQIVRSDSLYYVLALLVPAGLPFVVRGWPLVLGMVPPLGVLLTWDVDGSTCIALQYVTLLIPAVVAASILGASRLAERCADRTHAMAAAGVGALAASLSASIFFGALPVSGRTTPFDLTSEARAALAPRRAILDRAAGMVGGRDATTLASCRLAAHLLGAGRLEDVKLTLVKLGAFRQEASPRRWIEVFDWVAVDLADRWWNHSLDELKVVVEEAEAAGYRAVLAEQGVLVYARPDGKTSSAPDAIASRRVAEDAAGPSGGIAPGLRVARLHMEAVPGGARPTAVDVQIVLQAIQASVPEYAYEVRLCDGSGAVVAASGLRLPLDGNRPTSWWKAGEAWVDRLRIPFPAGAVPGELHAEVSAVRYPDGSSP